MRLYYFLAIQQILRTGHWLTDLVTEELKEFQISEPQFNVLRILRARRGRPIAVQDIQRKMIQESSNVTRLIDKLLIKDLVYRSECPTNRRKMDIRITVKGLELLEKLDEKVEKMYDPLMDNISDAEAKTLARLIKKLKGKIHE